MEPSPPVIRPDPSGCRLSVSIVNYNTREQLRSCLVALASATADLDVEIRVVDNASSDGSAEMVFAEFPDVDLRALPTNVGFAAGNNEGVRGARGKYLLILNPDVQVSRDALFALIAHLDSEPEVAAVGPLLMGTDGIPHLEMYRRFPSAAQIVLFWTVLFNLSMRSSWLRRRFFEHDLRGSSPVAVDQIPGAAMLVRSEVMRSVGEMDPDYFIWFEDVDWCFRARRAGHELVILPAVQVRHEGGASFGAWNKRTRLHQFYRTFTRFLCKHELTGLRRFAVPVLLGDLHLKEAKQRLSSGMRGNRGASQGSLAPTRREVKDVVRRYQAGELVRFSDAGDSY
jgi:GT2 family glycosyltransferase